jgi:peptidoglycan/LPS O-acetylase OafA/YrhL
MIPQSLDVSIEPVRGSRSGFIDSLRGVSILVVMLYHGDQFFTVQASTLAPLFPSVLANALFQNGYYGVTIFFVISGFLITRISLVRYGNLRTIRPGNFYLFRFGRIAPCLFLALGVLLGLHFAHVPDFVYNTEKFSIFELLNYTLTFRYNLLFCKNGWGLLPWDILWSLSIEEMFYLFFPLLCLVLRNRGALLSCCLLLIVIGPIARIAGTTDFEKLYGYFSCFDLIALGCACAIVQPIVTNPVIARRLSFAISVVGLILSLYAIIALPIPDNIVAGPTVLGFGIAILLLGLTGRERRSGRFFAMLAWPLSVLGKRSYEIYLFHATILLLLIGYLKRPEFNFDLVAYSPVFLPLFVLVCATIGVLIGKFWSEPSNRFIRRLSREDFATADGKIPTANGRE